MASQLAAVCDAPSPLFIPIGRGLLATSIAATLTMPYGLLLRRLKEQFPYDWFRHVDAREQAFREDLRWLFPIKRVHFANKPVVLRAGGKEITDIDSLVFVKATGTLGLFQLKWQDPFGADPRERRSRMANLLPTANRWVEAVSGWVESHGPDALLSAAGFGKEALGKVREVRLFVLGRYHIGFSGSGPPDTRAAWSTWPEMIRLIDARGVVEDPVASLFDDMQAAHRDALKIAGTRSHRIPLPEFEVEVHEEVSVAERWSDI